MKKFVRSVAGLLATTLVLAACSQLSSPPGSTEPDILNPLACSPYITMDETIRVLKNSGLFPQSQWATAGAVAKAESGLCVRAKGPVNANGTTDYGLYQVNSVHGYSLTCLYDAACNTNAAHYVYSMQGWNAWTVYQTGAYRQHLGEARAAVNRVVGGGTTVSGTTANTGGYTGPYNLRSGPGTTHSVSGSIGGGVGVTIVCQTTGTSHTGPWGTSSIWDKLSTGKWISDAFVYTGSNGTVAPPCS